jgi:hypothetical protein
LEFTLKYQILGVVWLICAIFLVILRRVSTGAFNPLAGTNREMFLQGQANVLQNSFEQFIISVFAQLCLVAYMDGEYTIRIIPWVNFSFLIGRIAFWLGYPAYRGFGMLLGLGPTLAMTAVTVYKMMEHLFSS